MIQVTDVITNNPVFIAHDHVVAVFEIPEGDHKGKTGMNLINGSIIVTESMMTIVNEMRATR